MKRGGQLARRTALVAKVPLQRGAGLARSGLKSTTRLAAKPMWKVARYTGPTPATRWLVLTRDHFACVVCGNGGAVLHHRRPRGMSGSSGPAINLPSNLLTLCRSCHDQVESWRAHAERHGYIVRRGVGDPARVPVLVHGYGWALHDHDGNRERVSGDR